MITDWKEWFSKLRGHHERLFGLGEGLQEEDRYQAFLARMIEEGYVVANPKKKTVRKVKPKEDYWPDKFDVLWKDYPKKSGKIPARNAWNKLKPDYQLVDKIYEHFTEAYINTEKQFIPHFASYIRAEKWNDEIIKVKPKLLAVPNDDDKLWPFANKHGLKQPGTMSYFDYRNALRKEVEQKQLMAG